MKKELEKKLVEEFPGLFEDYGGPMSKTCMAFGCECGDGWFDLLHETCAKLMNLQGIEGTKFLQVKEKFGGLRIYVHATCESVHDIIEETERKSYEICEVCGKPGRERNTHWIKTLCDEHFLEVTTK